jgi:hypothetical protein
MVWKVWDAYPERDGGFKTRRPERPSRLQMPLRTRPVERDGNALALVAPLVGQLADPDPHLVGEHQCGRDEIESHLTPALPRRTRRGGGRQSPRPGPFGIGRHRPDRRLVAELRNPVIGLTPPADDDVGGRPARSRTGIACQDRKASAPPVAASERRALPAKRSAAAGSSLVSGRHGAGLRRVVVPPLPRALVSIVTPAKPPPTRKGDRSLTGVLRASSRVRSSITPS